MNSDYSYLWGSEELSADYEILEGNLLKAEKKLQEALTELDRQLKESAATLFGHKRRPNHKERCAANTKALNTAHDEIAKAKKGLFQFKLKNGNTE